MADKVLALKRYVLESLLVKVPTAGLDILERLHVVVSREWREARESR